MFVALFMVFVLSTPISGVEYANSSDERGSLIIEDFRSLMNAVARNETETVAKFVEAITKSGKRSEEAFNTTKDELRSVRKNGAFRRHNLSKIGVDGGHAATFKRESRAQPVEQGSGVELAQATLNHLGHWKSWDKLSDSEKAMAFSTLVERHDTVVHQIKELACALTFRFAVETFNERFNVDTAFSTANVEVIINELRAKIDERKTTLLRTIKALAHASVQSEDEANRKVLNTWLSLQDFVVDESVAESEHKAELTTALLRLKYADDEQEVLRVWQEDGKNFWPSRITSRKVRLVSSTVSSTKGKTSTKVLGTVPSTVSSITVPLIDEQKTWSTMSELLATDPSTSTSEAQPLYKLQQEFNLLVMDDEVITNLSELPGDLVERLIIDWKYSGTPAAVYTRNVVKILSQIAPSVSKQYLTCSWILFTHEFHKGLEPLIEFLSSKWEDQTWPEKVNRFCSRFDLFFWRFPSNQRVHPKFTLPPNYKLKKSDYDAYLAEFGTADPDARVVGEALLIHFNVTYK